MVLCVHAVGKDSVAWHAACFVTRIRIIFPRDKSESTPEYNTVPGNIIASDFIIVLENATSKFPVTCRLMGIMELVRQSFTFI